MFNSTVSDWVFLRVATEVRSCLKSLLYRCALFVDFFKHHLLTVHFIIQSSLTRGKYNMPTTDFEQCMLSKPSINPLHWVWIHYNSSSLSHKSTLPDVRRRFKDTRKLQQECLCGGEDVPEELLPDAEGILMGGGRCFTPFPKTDVWTKWEIPSPWAGQKWFSQTTKTWQGFNSNLSKENFDDDQCQKRLVQTNDSTEWISAASWLNKMEPPPHKRSHMAEAELTSSLLGDRGPCPTLPELWDILTWHFTSFSYTPLYWLRNLLKRHNTHFFLNAL